MYWSATPARLSQRLPRHDDALQDLVLPLSLEGAIPRSGMMSGLMPYLAVIMQEGQC
jgi:hypothetical protein